VAEFVVFAEGFFGGADHGVDAMPFVFGVVEVELFGTERAFEGDLVGRKWLGVGAFKGDHDGRKVAYSLFLRHRIFARVERWCGGD
jgi:hypothetical protein